MRTSEMIKSKFWRARDLEGQRPVTLTISDVTEELLGRGARQDVKCFLWFRDHQKGLQLNKTLVTLLELAYGPDSEAWVGQRIRLSYDPSVMFGDRAVGGVRLETPPGVLYTPGAALPGWGSGPQPPPGAPPAPVWDAKRQLWVTPQPPQGIAAQAPPPPVWNPLTSSWETVNPGTGEIGSQGRAPTISERVNAQHPPASAGPDDFGPLPPPNDEFDAGPSSSW
jgi:hypothetical protein